MSKKKIIVLLDLDGVLITTPPWKKDEIDTDGYSKFNEACVRYFNKLLNQIDGEIWLSSTRRTTKTVEEFNELFKHRKINSSIVGFVPEIGERVSRKDEIEHFVQMIKSKHYIIIDDDKSLSDLDSTIKSRWIQTEFLKGFGEKELQKAEEIINDFFPF